MLITYIRSSSYSNWDFCQMQYYLNYVLGLPQTTAKKAEQGTIVHKVMEILANCKKTIQDQPLDIQDFEFNDEHIGLVKWNNDIFMQPYTLTKPTVAEINRTRINKYKYKHDVKIPNNTIHYGQNFVDEIFERVYEYYSKEDWAPIDKKDCYNWTWMALEYKNGIFDPRRRTILTAEPHFDIEIDKPWAKYDWTLSDGQKISGNLRIRGTIDLITTYPGGIIEVVDWKGLPLDTNIPTPDGWSTMGELEVGDTVFDIDGQQTKVVGKSKVTNKQCYKISFDDTSHVICDEDHLWVLNTKEVKQVTKLKIKDRIDISKAIKTNESILPIDPYVLGIWLGDGRRRCGEISCNDPFILDEIKRRGYFLGADISCNNTCPQHTIYGLTTQLRKAHLLHNKHIPPIYLRASYTQRLELLRGLLDSDGHVNVLRKQCIFTNCNLKLSQDTKELLLSLGQRPLINYVTNKQFGRDIFVYPISFRPININPFLLPRKADKVNIKWGVGQSSVRCINKIEKIDNMDTQCIMVDSPTHTYLCTNNMIPTHNTGQRIDWTCKTKNNEKTYKKLRSDPQLMLYYYAVRHMYPDVNQAMVSIFYIRDGGPFTIHMDSEVAKKVEDKLCHRFQEIAACQQPVMQDTTQRDFRCTKICDYYKMTAPNGENMCKFIHEKIQKKGIDCVTNEYTQDNFSIDTYQAPGEAS